VRPAAIKLPKAHRVRAALAGGRVAIYWYRRRGGPLLMKFEGATIGEALRAEADGVEALIATYHQPVAPPSPTTVRDLVTLFKAAPEGFLKLRKSSTQAKWRPWLDQIVEDFGDLPAAALGAKGVRREFVNWRNKWSATPRTADYALQVLRRVLSWALDLELIEANPAAGIKGIYSNNRAEIIVEPHELQAVLKHTSKASGYAFRLAAATGMRRGDLVDLRWSEVSDFSIERGAEKSTSGRRLLVPLTQEARQVLAELRADRAKQKVIKADVAQYVLTSRQGQWTPDGLTSNWVKAAKLAGVDKNLNDLRGTGATAFCKVPLTDEEVADIMAWEPTRVRNIRKRYVDREHIAKGIIARIEAKSRGADE